MAGASPAQLQELASLNARIEQFSEQIRKEGPIIDKIQELRGKAIKLERQAKAGRLRKMSLARRGAKGRAIHKRGKPKQADELDELYDRMDRFEDSLDKIEELKDQRLAYIKRRRAVLEEIGVSFGVDTETAGKIAQEKENLRFIEEAIEKVRRARKLFKRAASIMSRGKEHLSKAKNAAAIDMVFGGGIVGAISTYQKHKSMNQASAAMAPARRCLRQANKLLASLDMKGATAGAGVPQISIILDVFVDGWIVDGSIHDKIAKAELDAEMSVNRVTRRAKQLDAVEDAFRQQHYRTENNIYELYLDAETAAAKELARNSGN